MYKISFIIPVHNRLEYNKECLGILDRQKDTSFFTKNEISIIVVDDGSTDGTKEWIEKNYPEVIVLVGDGNLWYSGSLNKGFKYAFDDLGCDFINVWENDIVPIDNYFENLQSILENWDEKTLISSKLIYKNQPEIIHSMGGTFDPRTGKKGLIARNMTDGPQYQQPLEIDWFSGQQILIHKSILEKVGNFDEKNFPQYHADIDFSLRAGKKGFKIMMYPGLKLLNDTEATGINYVHNPSFRQFMQSLFSMRSNSNIRRNIKFWRKHTTSILAYKELIKTYIVHVGNFIRWKVLGWFGIKRKNENLI
ncbi:hypothetical protein ES705_20755 [subsurface metagenome]